MKKSLFSKLALFLLMLPALFMGCEKVGFKSFDVGETSGEGVQSRPIFRTCIHPGTGLTECEIDLNEDESNDLNFVHSEDAGTPVTNIRIPSGTSIVIDSVYQSQNKIWIRELAKGDELSDGSNWFEATKNVTNVLIEDTEGDGTGYFGFRWGTNTQRKYGWVKLSWSNDTDFAVEGWAFQRIEVKD